MHAIAAKNEALEWRCFRTGGVTIAGTDYMPPSHKILDECFHEMVKQSNKITDPYYQSIFIFLEMARTQFFYDVNKRMGRFIMNGNLLSKGYPVINVPASRQLEFNQKMLAFYESHNHQEMTDFMLSCLNKNAIAIMSE